MQGHLLAEIEGFDSKQSLKPAETLITTSEGKKYVEKKDPSGSSLLEPQAEKGLGFCIDLTPDLNVGVAMQDLLVGSQDVAHDLSLLTRLGVTHILNVARGIANVFTDKMEYLKVEMFDDDQQDLLSHYPQCQQFIDEGRQKGTVLVHCNAGRSRSSSVALAYVMHKEKLPLDTALERLRQTRPVAQPNQSFMRQLKKLEKTLNITPSTEVAP